MLCIETYSDDPAFNLAIEEILLTKSDNDYFLVYVNSPSVIIGKNQVASKEADTVFLAVNNIALYRRITGGGTVFHDYGNINFSFIFSNAGDRQINFIKHTAIINEFLSSYGVMAALGGKNDVRVDGLKISGNAEYVYHDRVLRHGTLLLDTDISLLNSCIRADQSAYKTRTVSSNPAEVTNIGCLINGFSGTDKFKKDFFDFVASRKDNEVASISFQYKKEAEQLASSRYCIWEWNYGSGPGYKVEKQFDYNGKMVRCLLSVDHGYIGECFLCGLDGSEEIASLLLGVRHHYPDISRLFENDRILKELPGNLF